MSRKHQQLIGIVLAILFTIGLAWQLEHGNDEVQNLNHQSECRWDAALGLEHCE